MIINNLNIISFGGLKNVSLTFEQGLNCIYGDNEQGKTTIMFFIKMMFYGSERGSSQISKNIRKKYTPWDGSSMAGSIEFELNGKPYRLEREFRSSNSTDKVSLTDLSLGEKKVAEADIGMRLFGISSAAFERSIFIGQLGFPDSDTAAESELNARLSNLTSTGDERVSLEEVSERLAKPRFSLISKSGRAGEYYKNLNIAKTLSEQLNTSVTANKQYLEGKERLVAHSKITAELTRKAKELKTKISAEQDIKNAQKLKELLETKEKLEQVKSELTLKDGNPLDEAFLRGLKFSLGKAENASAQVKTKENETEIVKKQLETLINGPKLSAEETPEKIGEELLGLDRNLQAVKITVNETKARLEELYTHKNGKSSKKAAFNPIVLILGIIFAVVSPFLFFTMQPFVPLSALALGVLLIILSFILKPKADNTLEQIGSLQNILNTQTEEINKISAQINEKKAKLEAIRLANTSNAQVIEAQRSQLALFESELQVIKNEEQKASSELSSFLDRLSYDGKTTEEILNTLENSVNRQKELKQQINFLLRDLNNISYAEAREKLQQIDTTALNLTENFPQIKQEYENLMLQIDDRKEKEITVATELKALISNAESPDILKERLDAVNSLLTSQKEFCDSIDIALEAITESFAELRHSYGSELEKKSAEIFSGLTNGKYENMTVSKSFGINVAESQHPLSREAEYLSSGTFDQVYLSLRLAVAELISENEPLPLFLDDALAQYDDMRTKKALEFLKSYCKNSQGIMFTCHKSIKDICETLSCNSTTIENRKP